MARINNKNEADTVFASLFMQQMNQLFMGIIQDECSKTCFATNGQINLRHNLIFSASSKIKSRDPNRLHDKMLIQRRKKFPRRRKKASKYYLRVVVLLAHFYVSLALSRDKNSDFFLPANFVVYQSNAKGILRWKLFAHEREKGQKNPAS